MKVLFLDIDGVLNSAASIAAETGARTGAVQRMNQLEHTLRALDQPASTSHGLTFTATTIDPTAVALIDRLLERDEDLRLVLSSTHRFYLSSNLTIFLTREHISRLGAYLYALGIQLAPERLVGATPDYASNEIGSRRRGAECAGWLAHARSLGFTITHSVAVDDGGDFTEEDGVTLVMTNGELGLTARDYQRLAKELEINEATSST